MKFPYFFSGGKKIGVKFLSTVGVGLFSTVTNEMKYYIISFDCETTGLSVARDQIVEFGAVVRLWDTDGDIQELAPFAMYCRPTVATMSRRASEITGITMSSLDKHPTIKTVLESFKDHLEVVCADPDIPRVLVSYNGFAYDIPIVVAEAERCGLSATTYFRELRIQTSVDVLLFGREVLDATCLVRKANGKCSYRLGDVYVACCKRPLLNAHGAVADSRAVLDILGCADVQCRFHALLADSVGRKCVTNPMVLIRAIVARMHKGQATKKQSASKRFLDMFEASTNKKKKHKSGALE